MYPSLVDKPSDKEFEEIVKSSYNIAEVTKKLGFKWANCGENSRRKIRERMKKLGINEDDMKKNKSDDIKLKENELDIKNNFDFNCSGKSKHKGSISEQAVILKLLQNNIRVSKPLEDNYPYDLVVEFNNKFIKIQVKTGIIKKDKRSFTGYLTRSIIGKNKEYKNFNYSKNEVDWFAIYCLETEDICFVKNDGLMQRVTFRKK